MPLVTLTASTLADCDVLAEMNYQLYEDEQFDIPMTLAQLKERMRGFLDGKYEAHFIHADGQVAGYILIDPKASPAYLYHFFICRPCRGQHIGKEAFQVLLKHYKLTCLDLDAMVWNEKGISFWHAMGFRDRYYSMRRFAQSREPVMDEKLQLKSCTPEDVEVLVELNRQLNEDEQFDLPMTDEYMWQRFLDCIAGNRYLCHLFLYEGEVAGYALTDTQAQPVYLWHFFVCREWRRKKIGREALMRLIGLLDIDTLDLSAMVWNARGIGFWHAMGFRDRCLMMRYGE